MRFQLIARSAVFLSISFACQGTSFQQVAVACGENSYFSTLGLTCAEGGASAGAYLVISPYGSVDAFASANSVPGTPAVATASYSTDLTVTITGGAGSGYYVPCLTKTGATANGSQQNSVAIFFNVSAPYNAPGPCVGLESQYWIPFVFGVPQTHFLALSPDAFPFLGGGFASSQDSFTGFVALDLLGNRLTGVTIDFGQLPSPSVPEPNAGLMVLTGIAAVLAVGQRIPLRQRRAGWSPLNRSRNRGGKG